jgi:hypothetical protein
MQLDRSLMKSLLTECEDNPDGLLFTLGAAGGNESVRRERHAELLCEVGLLNRCGDQIFQLSM